MGRSRWRNRDSQHPHAGNGKRRAPKPQSMTATVTIDSVTPVCPGMSRPGLDGIVYMALLELDRLLREMRMNVPIPNSVEDEDSAVKWYLVYLSLLVDVALSDSAMSAVHSNDLAVLLKERMLVEYASKAMYCGDHPAYALWYTTIHAAESVAKKLRQGGVGPQEIADADAHLVALRTRFEAVANTQRVSLSRMMREQTRDGDPDRNDEYVWLYGAPSALLHGDPEGLPQLMRIREDGSQHIEINLEDAFLNALMVDAGSNALAFCKVFIAQFHPGNEAFENRLDSLDRKFKQLALKHSHGRNEETLASIREELASAITE